MLATTIAGSLPKPSWLATPETLWAPWRLPSETLLEGQRDAVLLALREQEQAGIDVVTDGEQARRHFVHAFVERLEGVDPARRTRIGIRGDRYVAEVPTVVGPVGRPVPVHVEEAAFARASTSAPAQVDAARADDRRRHRGRRPLRRPGAAGIGRGGRPQRRGARAGGARGGRDPARRARVQRRCLPPGDRGVGDRGARAGDRGRPVRDGRPHLLRLRDSAPMWSGRRRSAGSGGSTSGRSRCSRGARSARSRWSARRHASRSSCCASSAARGFSRASSTSRPIESRPPRRWRRRSVR